MFTDSVQQMIFLTLNPTLNRFIPNLPHHHHQFTSLTKNRTHLHPCLNLYRLHPDPNPHLHLHRSRTIWSPKNTAPLPFITTKNRLIPLTTAHTETDTANRIINITITLTDTDTLTITVNLNTDTDMDTNLIMDTDTVKDMDTLIPKEIMAMDIFKLFCVHCGWIYRQKEHFILLRNALKCVPKL